MAAGFSAGGEGGGCAGGPRRLSGLRPLAAADLGLHPRALTARRVVPGSASFTLSRQERGV